MEHLFIYMKGLGAIVGFLGYIIFFNWAWAKITKEKLWEDENILGMIFMPFILPLVLLVVLSIPYLIGKEVMM